MNVLFLTPYITDFTAYDLWLRPLGLMKLANTVHTRTDCRVFWLNPLDRYAVPGVTSEHDDGRGHFHRAVITKPDVFKSIPRNYARYGWPLELFFSRLNELPVMDLICMTTLMTYWVDGARFTLQAAKSHSPAAVAVVGGVLPTLMPAASRREIPSNRYISGPGETELLDIIRRMGGRVTPGANDSNAGIDRFLSPDDPAYPLLTSRGCPMRCSYCASRLLFPGFRERPVSEVIGEIGKARRRRRHFVFFDDALLIHKETRFLPLARAAIRMNLCLHTPNGIHVREIDAVTARALHGAGARTLRLSLETTSPSIHKRGSGKADTGAMHGAVDNLLAAGFSPADLETYVLWGLPGQSIASVHATLDFVETLGIIPRLADYSPVPGTPDCRRLQSAGRLGGPLDPHATNKVFHLFHTSGYSQNDIRGVRDRCREITLKVRNIYKSLPPGCLKSMHST